MLSLVKPLSSLSSAAVIAVLPWPRFLTSPAGKEPFTNWIWLDFYLKKWFRVACIALVSWGPSGNEEPREGQGPCREIHALIDPRLREENRQAGPASLPRNVSLEHPWSGGPGCRSAGPSASFHPGRNGMQSLSLWVVIWLLWGCNAENRSITWNCELHECMELERSVLQWGLWCQGLVRRPLCHGGNRATQAGSFELRNVLLVCSRALLKIRGLRGSCGSKEKHFHRAPRGKQDTRWF